MNLDNNRFMEDPSAPHIEEKVIQIRRVAKVVKGGRRLRFNAMVVVGDGQGNVGVGMGKATSVPDAVRKGNTEARKNMTKVNLSNSTIPHQVVWKFGAAKLLLKPAAPGTGVVAAGAVRAVLELAGVKDVVSKALGKTNPINFAKCTLEALTTLQDVSQERAMRRQLAESRTG